MITLALLLAVTVWIGARFGDEAGTIALWVGIVIVAAGLVRSMARHNRIYAHVLDELEEWRREE